MKNQIIWFVLGVCSCLYAFQVVDTTGRFDRIRAKEYYESKMETYHERRITDCHQRAMSWARTQIDSVLTGKSILIDVDSFLLHPKPVRPDKPELAVREDSMTVEPIYQVDSSSR